MADRWRTEFQRLQGHRAILQGKLSIPSNDATRAVLRGHLARVERKTAVHIGAAFVQADKERLADPLGRELALQAQYKRFGRHWSRERRAEYREQIYELQLEADEGVRLPEWTPPAPGWEERFQGVLTKYARAVGPVPKVI